MKEFDLAKHKIYRKKTNGGKVMKRIEIRVTQGGTLVKTFRFQTQAFTFNDGRQAAGWFYNCETLGASGTTNGYVIGSIIMSLPENKNIGSFSRSINEIKVEDEFKVHFLTVSKDGTEAFLTLDCKCTGIQNIAPPVEQGGYNPNKGDKPRQKTPEEIEWERKQIPRLVPQ